MHSGGWVASDATRYSLEDERPDWVSLVSVAVAVEDISEFNSAYKNIVRDYVQEYGIKRRYPLLKSDDINRWVDDWLIDDVFRDMTHELLQIESLDTIQITETSLHSRWVDVFTDDGDSKRMRSEDFLNQYLENYYNLISIWEYLRKEGSRPRTHSNVMTDDFSGKISPAWLEVGRKADKLKIVPKGDETYPLLSMADLLMEYIKQEVDHWDEKEIYEHLREHTPDKSGWVDSDAIQSDSELKDIAPAYRTTINTSPYYPSPTLYLDSGGKLNSSVVTSLDFYDYALAFARVHGGCVKFFDENQDRDYVTGQDYVICLNDDGSQYSYFQDMNARRVPKVLSRSEAIDLFQEELDAY